MKMTEEEQTQAKIVITFQSPGSADFSYQTEGVTPLQMLAAAEYLKIVAEASIVKSWNQQAIQATELASVRQMLAGKKML